ncbi:MAG: hypothetical protein AAGK66_08970 [Pseudomonadota bacterium]
MNNLVNQPSAAPTRKVTWMTFAALGSSIAADIAIGALPAMASVDVSELEMFIEAALITGVTFLVGYFTRERTNA